MKRAALAVALLALVAVPLARATEDHPTSMEVQQEMYCDDCQTTLADASSVSWTPAAIHQINQMISEGYKKSQIKSALAKKYYGHLRQLPAKAASNRPSLSDLEGEIMCPVCSTTLDQSDSPIAQRMKADISRRIAAGQSKQQIKDALVAQFGQQILAAPPKKGFNLLAWLLPIVLLLGGGLVVGFLSWRWSHTGEPGPPATAGLSPALERRVDEELARYDEG
jgi:cytochrome c-type biogenesis protein CcmH/NrfF